jgi:hypothetical protein
MYFAGLSDIYSQDIESIQGEKQKAMLNYAMQSSNNILGSMKKSSIGNMLGNMMLGSSMNSAFVGASNLLGLGHTAGSLPMSMVGQVRKYNPYINMNGA